MAKRVPKASLNRSDTPSNRTFACNNCSKGEEAYIFKENEMTGPLKNLCPNCGRGSYVEVHAA